MYNGDQGHGKEHEHFIVKVSLDSKDIMVQRFHDCFWNLGVKMLALKFHFTIKFLKRIWDQTMFYIENILWSICFSCWAQTLLLSYVKHGCKDYCHFEKWLKISFNNVQYVTLQKSIYILLLPFELKELWSPFSWHIQSHKNCSNLSRNKQDMAFGIERRNNSDISPWK